MQSFLFLSLHMKEYSLLSWQVLISNLFPVHDPWEKGMNHEREEREPRLIKNKRRITFTRPWITRFPLDSFLSFFSVLFSSQVTRTVSLFESDCLDPSRETTLFLTVFVLNPQEILDTQETVSSSVEVWYSYTTLVCPFTSKWIQYWPQETMFDQETNAFYSRFQESQPKSNIGIPESIFFVSLFWSVCRPFVTT